MQKSKRCPEPGSDKMAVWLNGLYVRSESRKQGIATELICASRGVAQNLYAFTDVVDLYTKVGWKIVSADKNGTVVRQVKIT